MPLVAIASFCGCAPYMGSCGWVVPEAGKALETVEARKPTGGDCECLNCKAPGRFRLHRADYTLEFWNGDRYFPQLYVRARGSDGTVLSLTSDPDVLLRMAPQVPAADTHGFEYFIRVGAADGSDLAKTLRIRVQLPDGKLLGTEEIGLRVESRKDLAVEYL